MFDASSDPTTNEKIPTTDPVGIFLPTSACLRGIDMIPVGCRKITYLKINVYGPFKQLERRLWWGGVLQRERHRLTESEWKQGPKPPFFFLN